VVQCRQGPIDGYLLHAAGFHILQGEVTIQCRRDLVTIEYLDQGHIEFSMNQGIQARFKTMGIEKVAENDGDARPFGGRGIFRQTAVEIGFAARLKGEQIPKQ